MARWNSLEGDTARGVYLALIHPNGHEVACQTMVLSVDETRLAGYMWVRMIGAEFNVVGRWIVRVHSGGMLLAEYDVEVFVSP
jgi:hypothetical protein